MSNKFRVIGVLRQADRERLLARFLASHARIYALHVTAAYRPSEDVARALGAKFGRHPVHCKVIGTFIDDSSESLLLSVGGETHRPDGLRYHLTLSVDDSTSPGEAAKRIDDGMVNWIDGPGFKVEFRRAGLSVDAYTENARLAVAA